MLMALTREISPAFESCQLTHVPRVPIDVERARAQHAAYEWALVEAGCTIRRLDTAPDLPDSVFIEDIAVVLEEGAIVCRPGAEARRAETAGVVEALVRHGRPLHRVQAPATLDGGDVLVIGREVFVGASSRTNRAAIDQLSRTLGAVGYTVRAVPVRGCLHLKSAVTAVAADTLLINPAWVPAETFRGLSLIDVDPEEPHAANGLTVGDAVIYPSSFPRTRERLERRGVRIRPVEVDELQKAEGAVTCCSLIFEL
jgi:dimethylargininase